MAASTRRHSRFVVCVSNDGFPTSLEERKIYRCLPDVRALRLSYVADALRHAGGRVKHGENWKPFLVRDRELITAQNPAERPRFSD